MNDAILLQSVEGLGDSPFAPEGAGVWQLLQREKEDVCGELLAEGPLLQEGPAQSLGRDPGAEKPSEIEWRHRSRLKARLRENNDAQDRLFDGNYGRCVECGKSIEARRLTADAAAALCLSCQRGAEGEVGFYTM